MDGLDRRRIELAVLDARAGAHDLHLAGPDDGSGAEAVAMLELAVEDPGEDLHVAMAVGAEPATGLDPVIVDHAERAESHVPGVEVVAERGGVPAVQPFEARAPALGWGSCRQLRLGSPPGLPRVCVPV